MMKKQQTFPPIYRGDLVIVKFEDGQGKRTHQGGNRPAVVVSNNSGNRHSEIVTLCLLSSQIHKKHYPVHLLLEPNETNRLKESSIIMTEQIRTVGKECIRFKIGKLTENETHSLNQVLKISLGL